jgi:hypothetical protein
MGSTALGKHIRITLLGAASAVLAACTTGGPATLEPEAQVQASAQPITAKKKAADRQAILSMAGDYKVTFDFTETVSFQEGYELKKPYVTGAHEMVRVIADTDNYISLQHILVVGDGEKMPLMPIKHWRQDWVFEPSEVMDFVGANTWTKRGVSKGQATGKWAQVVYQVDDTPRYTGVAAWKHDNGTSSWQSPPSWRPLPRRDATKRDDYHVIVATNRHAITPTGWVHEQDNAKVILTGDKPQTLVHEIGINTYKHFDGFDTKVGSDYWEKTESFWAEIRSEWAALMASHDTIGLTVLGEPSEMYMEILGIASEVEAGETSVEGAAKDAIEVLRGYITTNPDPAQKRLQAASGDDAYSR